MSPKRTRLERVLRIRRLEEEVARDKFLSCEQVARQSEEVAEGISAEIGRAQAELSETRVQRRIPPEDLLMAQYTLESLDRNLAELRRRARDLRVEAEGMRDEWEKTRQEMRALERLDEQLQSAELEDERRQESREMDEEALRRGPSGPALPTRDGLSSPDALPADERAVRPPGADTR
jgi:flagellar export protein FliJ